MSLVFGLSYSQYKDELLFRVKRVFYQINYELDGDGVSFNLNYIPHPDQGYWMMETQVTQALYRAVTGESPMVTTYTMSGNVWEWCADNYNNPGQHRLGAL